MNRHLKIAIIMVPLLALAGYGLAGWWLDRQQPAAANGQLRLLGTCQPSDNACVFQTPGLELKLISAVKQEQLQLAAYSSQAISDFSLALGNEQGFQQFPMMKSVDGRYWQLQISPTTNIRQFDQLRLAFKHQQQPVFAETQVRF
ncbi:hypothetical protein [Marinicella meishanensis]|uniref:hypothetical protein n=1 Tax=Marinicella meishanensis TaxID=2873263 RepID=UPI001CBC2A55|nr:hypothetical protein [Marinicella sp. NBU2979]